MRVTTGNFKAPRILPQLDQNDVIRTWEEAKIAVFRYNAASAYSAESSSAEEGRCVTIVSHRGDDRSYCIWKLK